MTFSDFCVIIVIVKILQKIILKKIKELKNIKCRNCGCGCGKCKYV